MILVDTSVWIDFLGGRDCWERDHLKQQLGDREAVAYIDLILLEVIQGFRKQSDRIQIEENFNKLVLLPQSRASIMFSTEIYQGLQRKGLCIRSSIDCLIAAIAMEFGAKVLHRDRDFTFIAEHYPLDVVVE